MRILYTFLSVFREVLHKNLVTLFLTYTHLSVLGLYYHPKRQFNHFFLFLM